MYMHKVKSILVAFCTDMLTYSTYTWFRDIENAQFKSHKLAVDPNSTKWAGISCRAGIRSSVYLSALQVSFFLSHQKLCCTHILTLNTQRRVDDWGIMLSVDIAVCFSVSESLWTLTGQTLIEFQITSFHYSAKTGQIHSLDIGSCVSLVTVGHCNLQCCLYILKIWCGQHVKQGLRSCV